MTVAADNWRTILTEGSEKILSSGEKQGNMYPSLQDNQSLFTKFHNVCEPLRRAILCLSFLKSSNLEFKYNSKEYVQFNGQDYVSLSDEDDRGLRAYEIIPCLKSGKDVISKGIVWVVKE